MSDEKLAFLLEFPLIFQRIHNGQQQYNGILCVDGKDFPITVSVLNGKCKLEELNGVNETIEDVESTGIVPFLRHLHGLLHRKTPENPTLVLRHLLTEYYEFKRFHLNVYESKLHLNNNNEGKIEIVTLDEGNRKHTCCVTITETCNFQMNCALPTILTQHLQHNNNLNVLYDQYLQILYKFDQFFDILQQFDQNCDVLEPIETNRKFAVTFRRLWLNDNCSLLIDLDPYNLNVMPHLKFIGPESFVNDNLRKLQGNYDRWRIDGDLFTNLLELLELDRFPRKCTDLKNSRELLLLTDLGECCICFSLNNLNGTVPDVICQNACCGNCFHNDCLFEWLVSVNAVWILDRLYGNCPNCEKKISCNFPSPH